jgi:recombination protein RecA
MTKKDELASVIANELNKQFKHHQTAYFLGDTEISPTDVTDWISTGSSILDLAISNRSNGGLAVGKISEITGLESTGKSLLGAHALANAQKQGGIAIYIDTESSVSHEFLEALGVNVSKMIYVQLETAEEIFEAIESIVTKIRESDQERLVAILVDSVAAASTKVEMETDFDKDGWATAKAIIISKAMRKLTQMIARQKVALIFTNQLRMKLGVMFGDPYTTSGGKAIGFHSSTRIRLKNGGQIKDTKGKTIGIKIKAQITKNRLGPPLRTAEFSMYFDRGIDDYGSWLQVLKEYNLIKQGGAWYTLIDQNGEELKFQSKKWEEKLEDEELKEYVYNLICDKLILKYQTHELGIDDVIETDKVIDDI